jgi:hypothetical protein
VASEDFTIIGGVVIVIITSATQRICIGVDFSFLVDKLELVGVKLNCPSSSATCGILSRINFSP